MEIENSKNFQNFQINFAFLTRKRGEKEEEGEEEGFEFCGCNHQQQLVKNLHENIERICNKDRMWGRGFWFEKEIDQRITTTLLLRTQFRD